jgi:hypothetical protein
MLALTPEFVLLFQLTANLSNTFRVAPTGSRPISFALQYHENPVPSSGESF